MAKRLISKDKVKKIATLTNQARRVAMIQGLPSTKVFGFHTETRSYFKVGNVEIRYTEGRNDYGDGNLDVNYNGSTVLSTRWMGYYFSMYPQIPQKDIIIESYHSGKKWESVVEGWANKRKRKQGLGMDQLLDLAK